MSKTTIDTPEGNVQIDSELFDGYIKESFEHLGQIESAKEQLKLIFEAVSEKTGLKKQKVAKYIKARFSANTDEAKALGDLFARLDEATGLTN